VGQDPGLLDAKGGLGWTPLVLASREGRPLVVRLLVEWGANPTTANKSAQHPLMLASL
jgi:ankyrin repeat protein